MVSLINAYGILKIVSTNKSQVTALNLKVIVSVNKSQDITWQSPQSGQGVRCMQNNFCALSF